MTREEFIEKWRGPYIQVTSMEEDLDAVIVVAQDDERDRLRAWAQDAARVVKKVYNSFAPGTEIENVCPEFVARLIQGCTTPLLSRTRELGLLK